MDYYKVCQYIEDNNSIIDDTKFNIVDNGDGSEVYIRKWEYTFDKPTRTDINKLDGKIQKKRQYSKELFRVECFTTQDLNELKPRDGAVIFNIDTKTIQVYYGNEWI